MCGQCTIDNDCLSCDSHIAEELQPALQADKLCAECMEQKILEMPEDSDEEEDDISDAMLDDDSEGEGMPKAMLLAQHTAVQAANLAQATRRPFLQEGAAATGPSSGVCMTKHTWEAGLSYCAGLSAQGEEGCMAGTGRRPVLRNDEKTAGHFCRKVAQTCQPLADVLCSPCHAGAGCIAGAGSQPALAA